MTEDVRKEIIRKLFDADKKLNEVDIVKAIETQFPRDDLDKMFTSGMGVQDVYAYISEEGDRLKRILLALDVAYTNLADITMALKERVGGNYNDQT